MASAKTILAPSPAPCDILSWAAAAEMKGSRSVNASPKCNCGRTSPIDAMGLTDGNNQDIPSSKVMNHRASGLRLARHTVKRALHGHADLHGLVRFLGIQCWCGVVAVNLEASRVSECQRSLFHRYFRFPLQIM